MRRCQALTMGGVLYCDHPPIGRFCITHWLDRWRWRWEWGAWALTINASALPHPQIWRDTERPIGWWGVHIAPDSTEPLIGLDWEPPRTIDTEAEDAHASVG